MTQSTDFSLEELFQILEGVENGDKRSKESLMTLQFLLGEAKKILNNIDEEQVLTVEQKDRISDLKVLANYAENILTAKIAEFD